jgi:dsDNA-binding SOS-regulon protein
MAVESRFVVIRNGVEAKTFMDKKSADEYDRMLDMADNLSQMLSQSSVELTDSASEELSIYLAQNREELLVALLAKKPTKESPNKKSKKVVDTSVTEVIENEEQKKGVDKLSEVKTKKSKAKITTTKLSEAS